MNFKIPVLVLLLALSACNGNYVPVEECFEQLSANTSIGELRQAVGDGETPLRNDYVVVGRVTANDRGGNFYGTIVIEDASGALEINTGFRDLHALYPVGIEVGVKACGLSGAVFDGVLQLGLRIDKWNAGYRVEALGSRVVVDRHLFRCAAVQEMVPAVVSIANLNPSLCGRLVTIEGLTYGGEEALWGDTLFGAQAERLFTDQGGNVIAVAVSRYADFAALTVPRVRLRLTGILYAGATSPEAEYTLKIRTEEDAVEY